MNLLYFFLYRLSSPCARPPRAQSLGGEIHPALASGAGCFIVISLYLKGGLVLPTAASCDGKASLNFPLQ
jgi:hypothetical protein